MASDMELIERFQDSAQAVVLRDILKSNGFKASIKGQDGLGGSGARLAGGYLVMVPRDELSGAQAYLKLLEKEAQLHADDAGAMVELPKLAPGAIPEACPFCKSKNFAAVETSGVFRVIVTILLLGLPLLFPAPRTWHCKDCEQHWS